MRFKDFTRKIQEGHRVKRHVSLLQVLETTLKRICFMIPSTLISGPTSSGSE